MANAPKPITLTQIDAIDYEGPEPQPFVAVGDIPAPAPFDLAAALAGLVGFDAEKVQTLTNDEGDFVWVTNTEEV